MATYTPKNSRQIKTQSAVAGIKKVFVVAAIVYATWTIGQSIYRNYETNQKIASLKREISELMIEIKQLQNLILYYQTDSFREIEARRRLGLTGPGEEVVILPKRADSQVKQSGEAATDRQGDPEEPNYFKWWKYIFNQS